MADPRDPPSYDVERAYSKEQKVDVSNGAHEVSDSPEYQEFLRLNETFQGKTLDRLHVSLARSSCRRKLMRCRERPIGMSSHRFLWFIA